MTGPPKCAEHQACYRSPPWVSTRPASTDELKEHPVLGFRQLHDHLQAFKTGLNEATGIAEAARRESNEDRSIGLWQSLFCQRLHGAQGGRQTVSDRSAVLLEHQLNELKLWTFQREYGKVAGQCVTEDVDHPGYLLRLSELELIHRHHRMVERRIRPARFPTTQIHHLTVERASVTLVVGWMGSQLAVSVLIRWSKKPQTGPKTVWQTFSAVVGHSTASALG